MYVQLENLEIELNSANLPSRRCMMLEDSNHSVFPISYSSRELLVRSQLKPNSFPSVWETHFHIGLDAVPVQRVARYRQIRWPFYHQFTVVTTVKIPPSTLKTDMFSLQTKEGRNVLLDDLDPAANGISFRIDRTSKMKSENEDSKIAILADFDRIEIILPGTKPLGGPEASGFELTWCLTQKPEMEPTRFSLCVGDISLVARWVSKVNKVRRSRNIAPLLLFN
jgi:hypothetical protein